MARGVSGAAIVAKKKQEPRGVGIMTRLDPDVVRMARVVAPIKGQMMTTYLSEILRPVVSKDYVTEMRRLEQEGGKK
jgi:hypothetical protein